jgi:heptosyltransferase III
MTTVLIYRLGFLGDTIISLPAVAEIVRLHPDADLYLLTETTAPTNQSSAKAILGKVFNLAGTLEYEPGMGLSGWWALAARIRARQFAALYYLAPLRHSVKRTVRDYLFFRALCGIPQIHGLRTWRPRNAHGGREIDRVYGLVAEGRPLQDTAFQFPTSPEEESRVLSLLGRDPRETGERLIALCPGSKMASKHWPAERYAEVGLRLLEDGRTSLVLVGDRKDQAGADSVHDRLGARSLDVTGRLSVFESAFLLSLCKAYVGNDTGAMHLAAAVGTPCVALFSARDVRGKWDPVGKGHIVLRKELECAGCMLEVCDRQNACLASISVDEVVEAYRTLEPRL